MRKKIESFFVHFELIVMIFIVLIPIVWIVLSAFNPGNGLATSSLLPKSLTLDNFKKLFTETSYIHWFANSFIVATLSSFLSVIAILITAWIMSRFHFKGKKVSLMTVLVISTFPTFLSMTAYYTLFLTLGLLDNPISLVIIYVAASIPYNVWLVKGYLDGVPKEIDEAAYIDGCSYFKTFRKIVIPLAKPIITYCAVSQFMLPWMDYILPNMLLSSDSSKTLAVGLYSLISGKENTYFTVFSAGAILIAVPITILFIIFQKYLAQGIAAGANKG